MRFAECVKPDALIHHRASVNQALSIRLSIVPVATHGSTEGNAAVARTSGKASAGVCGVIDIRPSPYLTGQLHVFTIGEAVKALPGSSRTGSSTFRISHGLTVRTG